GWTLLVYMLLPLVRILTGAQPVAASGADQFLLHFAPYFFLALSTVAVAGSGTYTFAGYTLAASSFWIHLVATARALVRRPGRFVVTPKSGTAGWPLRAIWPALLAIVLLSTASVAGLTYSHDAGMLNNVAF